MSRLASQISRTEMVVGVSVLSQPRSFAPEALHERRRLMIAAARALPAETPTETVHDLVERGSELSTIAVRDHGLGAVDVYDCLDPPRMALLDVDHLGSGRTRLVFRQRFDLRLRPLEDLGRDVTVSCGDLDSHPQPRSEEGHSGSWARESGPGN